VAADEWRSTRWVVHVCTGAVQERGEAVVRRRQEQGGGGGGGPDALLPAGGVRIAASEELDCEQLYYCGSHAQTEQLLLHGLAGAAIGVPTGDGGVEVVLLFSDPSLALKLCGHTQQQEQQVRHWVCSVWLGGAAGSAPATVRVCSARLHCF
jgi:hypothetical protein